jgi:hypothetical protein
MRLKSFFLIAMAAVPALILAGCPAPAIAPYSFTDTFDRPDAVAPGNGWSTYAAAGGSTALSNQSVALYSAGISSSGIYRTFDTFSGDFDIEVETILDSSTLQIWMQNGPSNLYMANFSATTIEIRKENAVLQNAAVTATSGHLFLISFRKTAGTLYMRLVDIVNPGSPTQIQATETTYNSYMGLQLWGGGTGTATWITSVSIKNG